MLPSRGTFSENLCTDFALEIKRQQHLFTLHQERITFNNPFNSAT